MILGVESFPGNREVCGETVAQTSGQSGFRAPGFEVIPGKDALAPEMALEPQPHAGEVQKGAAKQRGLPQDLPGSLNP